VRPLDVAEQVANFHLTWRGSGVCFVDDAIDHRPGCASSAEARTSIMFNLSALPLSCAR